MTFIGSIINVGLETPVIGSKRKNEIVFPSKNCLSHYSVCVQSLITLDGDKLVHVQKWDGKETTLVREVGDNSLTLVSIVCVLTVSASLAENRVIRTVSKSITGSAAHLMITYANIYGCLTAWMNICQQTNLFLLLTDIDTRRCCLHTTLHQGGIKGKLNRNPSSSVVMYISSVFCGVHPLHLHRSSNTE